MFLNKRFPAINGAFESYTQTCTTDIVFFGFGSHFKKQLQRPFRLILLSSRWYLLYMAAHPAVQSLVQEELDHVTLGRPVSLEHRASLPLAEASLAEAQRIRPVVPLGIPHGTVRDTEIGGFGVPGGAMVVPLQWAVHMDPLLWEDPERFEPRRFLDEEGRFFRPEGFLPFQTGG